MSETTIARVEEWARKRVLMALAYLEWLAETARLDRATLEELEHLYPGLGAYATLGQPVRQCSRTELQALAERPGLVINETDLSRLMKTLDGLRAADVEARLLAALVSARRPR